MTAAVRPRLAMMTPERPSPPTSGGQLRMSQHVAVLRRMGWDVRVIAFVDAALPVPASPPEPWLDLDPFYPEPPVRRYLRLAKAIGTRRHPQALRLEPLVDRALGSLEAWRPDLLVLEYSMFAAFLPKVRRRLPTVPVIVDAHNAETKLLAEFVRSSGRTRARWINRMRWWWMSRIESRWLPLADEVWVPSSGDAVALRAMGVSRVRIIPNAIDTEAYAPTAAPPAHRLVFSGTMDYLPNIDGAEWLCDRIMPAVHREIADVQVDLVGKSPAQIAHLAGPATTVTGFVADPRPFLARAAAVVVPLRIGSGTRLKILEALAMEKAVVTTRKGCEGLDVLDGIHVMVADDAAAFAARVISVLREPDLRRRLGAAGRRLVVERYSWQAVQETMKTTLAGSALAESR